MKSTDIKKDFQEKLRFIQIDSSEDLDISKLISIPFNSYFEIIILFRKLDSDTQSIYKKIILDSLNNKSSLLLQNNNHIQCLRLFKILDHEIYLTDKFQNHFLFLNLSIKYILCLIEDNDIVRAYFKCKSLINYFKSNSELMYNNAKSDNDKLAHLNFELIQVRSIIKLIVNKCKTNNLHQRFYDFIRFSKYFEKLILKTGSLDNNLSDKTKIQPSIKGPYEVTEIVLWDIVGMCQSILDTLVV